jgi:hypothetical protein
MHLAALPWATPGPEPELDPEPEREEWGPGNGELAIGALTPDAPVTCPPCAGVEPCDEPPACEEPPPCEESRPSDGVPASEDEPPCDGTPPELDSCDSASTPAPLSIPTFFSPATAVRIKAV